MKPDILIIGQWVYTLYGETARGCAWIAKHVGFEAWQGTPQTGIAIDGGNYARDVAAGATASGLVVAVNGHTLAFSPFRRTGA